MILAAALALAAQPVINAASPRLTIVDGTDRRAAELARPGVLDTYVAHPAPSPRRIAYITDRGRFEAVLEDGEEARFTIRHAGRDYPQRIVTSDPAFTAYQGRAARPGGVDEWPFRLSRHHAIIVTGRINGSAPLDLLFDTGASLLVIGEGARAKGARLAPDRGNRLSLAGVEIGALAGTEIDYRGTLGADGVIGFPAFAGRVIEIDYGRRLLRVHHDRPPIAGFSRLPILWDEQQMMVPLTADLGGGRRLDRLAIFDTGSRFGLSMTRAAGEALAPLRTTGWRMSRRSDGSRVFLRVVSLPALNLGAARLQGVQADIELPIGRPNLTFDILGNDALRRFDTIVDLKRGELWLRPNAQGPLPYKRPLTTLAIAGILVGLIAMLAGAFLAARRLACRLS